MTTIINRPYISKQSLREHGDNFAPKVANVTTIYTSKGFKAGVRKYFDAYKVMNDEYKSQRHKIWAKGTLAGAGIGGGPSSVAWHLGKVTGPWFAGITAFTSGVGLVLAMKKDFESVQSLGELDEARNKHENLLLVDLFNGVTETLCGTDAFLKLCKCFKCGELLFPKAFVSNTGRYYDRKECVLSSNEKPLKSDYLVTYSVHKQLIHAFQAVRGNSSLSPNGVLSRPYQLVENLIAGLKDDKAKIFSRYSKFLQKIKKNYLLNYSWREWAKNEKKILSNLGQKVFFPRDLGTACVVWTRLPTE